MTAMEHPEQDLSHLDVPKFLAAFSAYLASDLYTALNWMSELSGDLDGDTASLHSFIEKLVQKFQELVLQSQAVLYLIMQGVQRDRESAWEVASQYHTELPVEPLTLSQSLPFNSLHYHFPSQVHPASPFSPSITETCCAHHSPNLPSLLPVTSTEQLHGFLHNLCHSMNLTEHYVLSIFSLPPSFATTSPKSPSPKVDSCLPSVEQQGPIPEEVLAILNNPNAESLYVNTDLGQAGLNNGLTEENVPVELDGIGGSELPTGSWGTVSNDCDFMDIGEGEHGVGAEGSGPPFPFFLPSSTSPKITPEVLLTDASTTHLETGSLTSSGDRDNAQLDCEEFLKTEYSYNSIFNAPSIFPSPHCMPGFIGEFLSDGKDIYQLVSTYPVTYELVLQEMAEITIPIYNGCVNGIDYNWGF
ncbi:hypothetical protein GYMLUDRAFT_65526 [Collybiopsis luxurians FD-317 M1]|uniref:Uncharacterized protein n=1 Tax=Collybiopsis luxurians FD-317 M1 TaxID=944289 RepID=A0A0D0C4U2_9AGAR|nr:hypothetical protein GYMLUDRAFT_65526 [Collybiopsis luxurians FD-317 M1]